MSKELDQEIVTMSERLNSSVKFFVTKLNDPETRGQLSSSAFNKILENMQEMVSSLIPTSMKRAERQNPETD